MNDADRMGFSISKLVVFLLVTLFLVIAALWIRSGEMLGLSSGLHLDEAHVHGAISSVGAQTDGRISKMHVGLGDRVEAGDILFTLETSSLRAQVDATYPILNQRRLELERAEIAHQIEKAQAEQALTRALNEVDAGKARLSAAQAQRDLRQSELERMRRLAANEVVSQAELETAREAANAADALVERRQAELNVDRAQVTSQRIRLDREALRTLDLDIQRQQVAEVEATLRHLYTRIGQSTIRALEDGVVLALAARVGDSVVAGDTKLEIWRTDNIWIRAWVSEDDVQVIERGDPAKVWISAVSETPFNATVHRVLVSRDGKANTSPGQPISPVLPDDSEFAVQLILDAGATARQRVLPGMSAEARIPVPK